MFLRFLAFIFSLTLLSCQSKPVDFGSFDFGRWKADPKGCQNTRIYLEKDLDAMKENIIGLSQNEVLEYFGKPDAQILGGRNQKYYIYFLEAGNQCQPAIQQASQARSMAFRFNAISRIVEITFQNGKP